MNPVLHGRSSRVISKNLASVSLNVDFLQLGIAVFARVFLYCWHRRVAACGTRLWKSGMERERRDGRGKGVTLMMPRSTDGRWAKDGARTVCIA